MNARPAREPAGANAVAHVFVDALDDRCEISGPDGHHLQRVRRLTAGETVTAADGSGGWRVYEIVEVGTGRLELDARGELEHVAPALVEIGLALALTKGGLDDVLAAVTELGVARVTPVRTARAVARWDKSRGERAVARLRTVAREAAMQSRRATVPVVTDVVELSDLVDRPGLVVADLEGVEAGELPKPDAGSYWTALVGPEGGLAPDELEMLSSAPRFRLGAHVLRAATAPIAAVAILGAEVARMGRE